LVWSSLLKIFWALPVLISLKLECLMKFNISKLYFRLQIDCLWCPDRFLLVEISFRTTKCTIYMILDTIILLRTWKLQRQRGITVKRLTHCTTKNTIVIQFAPCVRRHNHVLKIRQSIVLCATSGFSVRKIFSESFDPQSERQDTLQWRPVCRN
jgi:hypothetical protein